MSETLSPGGPEQNEKEPKVYNSISEYLSAFEESPIFQDALARRRKELQTNQSEVELSEAELRESLRMTAGLTSESKLFRNYTDLLLDFYATNKSVNPDINVYGEEVKNSIQNYFNYLDRANENYTLRRVTASDKQQEQARMLQAVQNRDRYHNQAALDLLGDGIELANGDILTYREDLPEVPEPLDRLAWLHLGRTLVHILAVENGKDTLDYDREINKELAKEAYFSGKARLTGEEE